MPLLNSWSGLNAPILASRDVGAKPSVSGVSWRRGQENEDRLKNLCFPFLERLHSTMRVRPASEEALSRNDCATVIAKPETGVPPKLLK